MAVAEAPPTTLRKVPWVANRLNISVAQCWRLVASGAIPSVRISERCIRVDEAELERWLKEKKGSAAR
jgi:excisionase family DNA binding protein